MTRSRYALEEGAPRRLTIAVTAFGDAEVEFDGQVIAAFSRGELRKGSVQVALPDGTAVIVRCALSFLGRSFELTRGGRPLPGSEGDPRRRLRQAAIALYVVAAEVLLSGGVLALQHQHDQSGVPVMVLVISSVLALVLAVLGFLASRGSAPTLIAAIALYGLLSLVSIADAFAANARPSWVLLQVVVLYLLLRGLQGARAMRNAAHAVEDEPLEEAA